MGQMSRAAVMQPVFRRPMYWGTAYRLCDKNIAEWGGLWHIFDLFIYSMEVKSHPCVYLCTRLCTL